MQVPMSYDRVIGSYSVSTALEMALCSAWVTVGGVQPRLRARFTASTICQAAKLETPI